MVLQYKDGQLFCFIIQKHRFLHGISDVYWANQIVD